MTMLVAQAIARLLVPTPNKMGSVRNREVAMAVAQARMRYVTPAAKEAAEQAAQRMIATAHKKGDKRFVSLSANLMNRLEETRVALGDARAKALVIEAERRASQMDGAAIRSCFWRSSSLFSPYFAHLVILYYLLLQERCCALSRTTPADTK